MKDYDQNPQDENPFQNFLDFADYIFESSNKDHHIVKMLLTHLSKTLTEQPDDLEVMVAALKRVINNENDALGLNLKTMLNAFPPYILVKLIETPAHSASRSTPSARSSRRDDSLSFLEAIAKAISETKTAAVVHARKIAHLYGGQRQQYIDNHLDRHLKFATQYSEVQKIIDDDAKLVKLSELYKSFGGICDDVITLYDTYPTPSYDEWYQNAYATISRKITDFLDTAKADLELKNMRPNATSTCEDTHSAENLQRIMNRYNQSASAILRKKHSEINKSPITQTHSLNIELLNGLIKKFDVTKFYCADSTTLNCALALRQFDIVKGLCGIGVKPNKHTIALASFGGRTSYEKSIEIGATASPQTLKFIHEHNPNFECLDDLSRLPGSMLPSSKVVLKDNMAAVAEVLEKNMPKTNANETQRPCLASTLISVLTATDNSNLNTQLIQCFLQYAGDIKEKNHYKLFGINAPEQQWPTTQKKAINKERVSKMVGSKKNLLLTLHDDKIECNTAITRSFVIPDELTQADRKTLVSQGCVNNDEPINVKTLALDMTQTLIYAYDDIIDARDIPERNKQSEASGYSSQLFKPKATKPKTTTPPSPTFIKKRRPITEDSIKLLRAALQNDVETAIRLLDKGTQFNLEALENCPEREVEKGMDLLVKTFCVCVDLYYKSNLEALLNIIDRSCAQTLYEHVKQSSLSPILLSKIYWMGL